MELILYNPNQHNHTPVTGALTVISNNEDIASSSKFIEANTRESTLAEIKSQHIIPVFSRSNEPLISQAEFIETTHEVVQEVFKGERVTAPSIRLSHEIKGRTFEARNKPVSELQEWEKTVYYERCAFIIEIPSISDSIDGESMSLTVAGVKSYNLDNLNNRKGADEHFKIGIGWKVKVCTNLCIFTDGYTYDLRVRNYEQLRLGIYHLLKGFDAITQLKKMEALQQYSLTEHQFAQLIGRCRLYQHFPANQKQNIPDLQFGDSMVNSVCKDYYRDNSFCRDNNGDINLWRLYNLFTAANKQSYIDSFLDRAVNASSFTGELAYALEHRTTNWFLS
jgi:hypothetical protein